MLQIKRLEMWFITVRDDGYSSEIPIHFFLFLFLHFSLTYLPKRTVLISIVQGGANACTKILDEFLLFEFARNFIKEHCSSGQADHISQPISPCSLNADLPRTKCMYTYTGACVKAVLNIFHASSSWQHFARKPGT